VSKRLPLEGIRVADLTIWIQGPLASAILADLGAEVVKIEKPGMGDFSRGTTSLFGQPNVTPSGHNLLWEAGNRNKKAVAINLYHPKGREAFYRLLEKCDVLVTNLSPQALRQMGADEETVRQRVPDIIYARASGFGPRGPYAEDPCQDTAGMARSAFMYVCATADGEPVYPPGALSDVLSATMLAFGVVTALLGRERTGEAPEIVYASQMSTMMWTAMFHVMLHANTGLEYAPFDRTDVANPLMNIYKCGDGKWIALGLFLSQRFWPDFCEVTGLEHLREDPRFATDEARYENRKELISIIDQAMLKRPRHEWEELFRQRGFWFSVVNRPSDLINDPQVVANNYIVSLADGFKAPALPFELVGMEPRRQGPPEFGQHTDQVLQEVCGYSWDDIVAMKAENAVW